MIKCNGKRNFDPHYFTYIIYVQDFFEHFKLVILKDAAVQYIIHCVLREVKYLSKSLYYHCFYLGAGCLTKMDSSGSSLPQ